MPSAFHPHQGGVEELTLRLAQELAKTGPAPLVLTNRWPRDLPTTDTVEGIEVLRHPMRPGPGKGLRGRVLVQEARLREERLIQQLRRRQISLVHVQCVSNQAYLAQRIVHRLGVPLVVTLHGELSMDATGIYATNSMQQACRDLVDRADAVSGCSRFVLEEAARFHSCLRSDAVAILNGVHVPEPLPSVPEEGPYLFAAGRLVRQKGFDILLQALTRTSTGHRVVIAGDGACRQELEHLARSLRLGDRVRFLGSVPHDEVLRWCAGAVAFVLPSRHEPQGIVILEAMAVGTLVIAASVGGVPETVVPDRTGFLFPPESPGELARVLDEVVGRPHEAVLETAKALARKQTWSTVAAEYQQLYRQAHASHAGKPIQAR